MIRVLTTASVGIAMLGLAACTNPDGTRNNQMTGATVGAVGGAAAGNLIGGNSRSTLIGAGVGAAGGALVGRQQDCRQNPNARC
ncbi:glycine zipper domain-containing protein [Amaricoccus sp.]|uniref:glycine zipper domain-containing protein n=1 Tax=Amaricoccus sp. TaxID=1872485 RepID=UPI001B54B1EA|nr:glycine zipper domain-containing protein [Amaricoccus sp.]MBP7002106.1 glycine zipper 2TM domain-containing protein [Amaricoccus sp.]